MAQPTSSIHICNLALARLGQAAISSIDSPVTTAEIRCELAYIPTRREILREFLFSCSKRYVSLTADALMEPAFGYSTAYKLPNDFIRLRSLGDVTIGPGTSPRLYDISEGYIFTDQNDSEGGGIDIVYTWDADVVAKYDSLLVKVLWLQLAMNMAYAFTLKSSLRKEIEMELADVRLKAAAISGQEKPPIRIERSRLISVRRRGGNTQDPTRYP